MTSTAARRAQQRRASFAGSARLGRRVLAGVTGVGVVLGSTAVVVPSAHADDPFTVTDAGDSGPGTLRAALDAAMATPGDDVITFAPSVTGIDLTSGELAATLSDHTGGVEIRGGGSVTIAAAEGSRVFHFGGYGGTGQSVVLSGLTVTGGAPSEDGSVGLKSGGAILSERVDLTLDQMTVSGNTAWNGGGVHFYGLYGSLTVTDSTIDDNQAFSGFGGGGGISASGGEVIVTGSTISSNTAKSEDFYFYDGVKSYYGSGGGIRTTTDLSLIDSVVIGNESGGRGGGVHASRSVTIVGSTIADNASGASGGGLEAGYKDLSVEGSTISGNNARWGGAGIALSLDGSGAGGRVIRNSTISGNRAESGVGGGLLARHEGKPLTITGSTIAGNVGSGVAAQGAFHYFDVAGITLQSSVIGGNVGPDLTGDGAFTLDHALVQDPGTTAPIDGGASLIGADPLLLALADNGGPTQTMLPASNSPLIDAGKAFGAATDQRGEVRSFDAPSVENAADGTDIGAVEVQDGEFTDPMLANASAPSISGTAQEGETLTADPGTWTPAPDSVSYQWLRDGAPIEGATAVTYVAAKADWDAMLSVRVTASASGHLDNQASSAPVGPVLPVPVAEPEPITTTAAPSVSGVAKVGEVLTGRGGSWDPSDAQLTYQWLRNGAAISGATSRSYTLTPEDRRKRLSLQVTATKADHLTATATSAQTSRVVKGTMTRLTQSRIKGKPRVGNTLRAVPGRWDPSPQRIKYRWFVDGTRVKGPRGGQRRFDLKPRHRGKRMSVRIVVVGPDGYKNERFRVVKKKRVR